MDKTLISIGRLSGLFGLLLCLGSGAARLAGHHWLGGFETLTLLQAGMAGLLAGCFSLLLALTLKP